MLEFDGCSECRYKAGIVTDDRKNWSNVIFYANHGDVSKTDCFPNIRNGLSNTMLYLTQPANSRRNFNEYMSELSLKLSSSAQISPVYWPQPIKVDQNHFWQISNNFAMPGQEKLIRYCPENINGPGRTHDPTFDAVFYQAQSCGDLGGIQNNLQKILSPTFVFYSKEFIDPNVDLLKKMFSRLLDRKYDEAGFEYYFGQIKSGTKMLDVCLFDFTYSLEFKNRHSNLTDQAYLAFIFNLLLRRAPDSAGEKYYLESLASKSKTRETIALDFIGSASLLN